ncbi:MAG TPA: GNAT family N-acetyltransferase [Burkholderiales bacterium]|nr:GNAT family N-acetyltransferase [Burkholderiales bacterium]
MAAPSVRAADWNVDRAALRAVREQVFVREQAVPIELEWDEFDPLCQHVVAEAASQAIGTGRLLPDGHIGRMAVLESWRGQGVGSALLEALLQIARNRGIRRVRLNAQSRAVTFYLHHGFVAEGEEFIEAGIPHRTMWRDV